MSDKLVQKPIYKRVFFFGVLLLGSILFSLILAEGVLRLVPGLLPVEVRQIIHRNPSNYGVGHPYIGHLQTPNNALVLSGRDYRAVHHTDGYGFRNSWPWPKEAQVVALGDSVTFGQGVADEQAWPAILARSFPASRVINLGLIGAGPQQYLRVFETFGLKLRPKVVLVGFFMGNDFWDAETFELWLKSDDKGNYMVWRDFGRPSSASLDLKQPIGELLRSLSWRVKLVLRKSYLCNLLLYVQGDSTGWLPSGKKVYKAPDGSQLELATETFVNNTKYARPGYRNFEFAVSALKEIHALAKANGANAIVILQRSKEEVYLPLLGESLSDAAAPLRDALAALGIPYIDLLEEFQRRASKGEVLFFETDGHPNARGYALIADLVTAYLRQHAREFGL
jgi:lysophospholipase L1-like esterase